MPLLAEYQARIKQNRITDDPVQEQAITALQGLLQDILTSPAKPAEKNGGVLTSLFRRTKPPVHTVKPRGIYLWGGVGRGKTWLMDLFFETAPLAEKRRYHFHHFMQMLHAELAHHPDQQDPLKKIAGEWAQKIRLLCLDELHLTEVTNAMLLFPMLQYLLEAGVAIVSTSNRHPSELYQGTLQLERFQPYSAFLLAHMQVIHLDNGIDYRTRGLEQAVGGQPQIRARTADELAACFAQMAEGLVRENVLLEIDGRQVPALRVSDNLVWLEFAVACEGARTTTDYIWLSDRFRAVFLSGVHVMTEDHEPAARRFFYLVDELYDRRVKLLFAADVTLDQLYQGHRLKFAFKRTLSRLYAMHVKGNVNHCELEEGRASLGN